MGSFGTGYSHVATEIGLDPNGSRQIAEAVPGRTRIVPLDNFMQQELGRGSTVDQYTPNSTLSDGQIAALTTAAANTQGLPYNYAVPLNLTAYGPTICSEYVNQIAGLAGNPLPITPLAIPVRPVMPSDISNSDTYHQAGLDYGGPPGSISSKE